MNLDIGRSVTYSFEDPGWPRKVGILFALGLIPGLNIIVWGGYALSVAHNILRRNANLLPDWTEWSDIAVRGLLSIAATFLYALPALIPLCGLWLLGGLLGERTGNGFVALQCCVGLFALVYYLAASLVLNVGHVRFAMTDQFYRYLEVGAHLRDLREDPTGFAMLFALQTILALIALAGALLLLPTCLGASAILTLAFLANGYILGSYAAAFASRPVRGL